MRSTDQRLRELVELNRFIASTLDFEEVLERVVEKTAEFTRADACVLLLAGADGKARVAASRGLSEASTRDFATRLDERISVALMELLGFEPADMFLGVPVIQREEVRGLLAVYRRGPVTSDGDSEYLVTALADQAAIALEHAARYRDLSHEKERQFRLLQAIQSNSSSYLVYLDDELRVVEANTGFCSALGRQASQIVGRPFGEVEGAPTILPLLQAVRATGEGGETQVRLRCRDGGSARTVYWNVGVRPVLTRRGRVEGLVISASDVTSEVLARKEVETANRRKDEFMAMLGHELRNPVAAIATAADVMRLGTSSEPVPAEVRDVVYRQVRHLARLLDDLLDVSRITRGTIELRKSRVDLRDAATLALQSVRQAVAARRQRLRADLPEQPVWLLGDSDRLVQVLTNLLTNASRYTPEGGSIELALEPAGDRVAIAVRDDGEGIAEADLPFLFEPFTQSRRGLDRPGGGLGLGLTLVKQLVELHGGSVAAHSAGPGRGSEFTIRLPLPAMDDPAQASRAESPAKSPTARRRVLIVEDNVDFAKSLALLLEGEGHRVEMALDGPQAIEMVERSAPDIVLLDIGLPQMDGFELARRIRRLEGPAPLLVAVSGYGSEEAVQRAREAGIDHYLVKPFWRERLSQLLAPE